MTLRIDEAEKAARTARFKLQEGEAAIAALNWLNENASGADLAVNCRTASGLPGHKDAMAYLNMELFQVMGEIIDRAKRNAQRDMDRCLGTPL